MISKFNKILQFGLPSLGKIQGSYSQFGEDFFLRWHFQMRPNGFYVDVGAFDPFYFSNTHYLYSLGWKGINIEPNPPQFEKIRKFRPRDINLNVAVSNIEEVVEFYPGGLLAGIVGEGFTTDVSDIGTIRVPARRLDAILAENVPPGTRIDFLSVDCEGHDIKVLQSNNWDLYRPEVIAIEDHQDAADTEVVRFAATLGYRLASWYRLTKFFVQVHQ